jgi:hypothetical protein
MSALFGRLELSCDRGEIEHAPYEYLRHLFARKSAFIRVIRGKQTLPKHRFVFSCNPV